MNNKRRVVESIQTVCIYFLVRIIITLIEHAIFKSINFGYGNTSIIFYSVLKTIMVGSSVAAYFAAKKFSDGEYDKTVLICCIVSAVTISPFFAVSNVSVAVDFILSFYVYKSIKKHKKKISIEDTVTAQAPRIRGYEEKLKESHPELVDYAKQLKWLFDREQKLNETIALLQKRALECTDDKLKNEQLEKQLTEEAKNLATIKTDIEALQNIITEIRKNYQIKVKV